MSINTNYILDLPSAPTGLNITNFVLLGEATAIADIEWTALDRKYSIDAYEVYYTANGEDWLQIPSVSCCGEYTKLVDLI